MYEYVDESGGDARLSYGSRLTLKPATEPAFAADQLGVDAICLFRYLLHPSLTRVQNVLSLTTPVRMTGAISSGDPGPSTLAARRLSTPPKQSQVDAEDLDDVLVGMLGERVQKSLANFRVRDSFEH
jgi:hypothetical protein